jgi:hypothetical protein
MAALARALSRVTGILVEIEDLKSIRIFCGVGLVVWLILARYGLDMSAGLF